MSKEINIDSGIYMGIVGLAGWAIPGAGHWILGQRLRAFVIFLGITLTFAIGLAIGSIGVIDPLHERLWFIPQMMVSPLVKILGNMTASNPDRFYCFGRPNEIGQIYTSMAGMLNLLCIINAVYLGHLKKTGEQES